MTMRSAPPASSHLAERPVPAPPPTIASPRAAIAWNFSIRFLRSNRGIVTSEPFGACLSPRAKCGRRRRRRKRNRDRDVTLDADDLTRRALARGLLDGAKQSRVGLRIVKGLAGRIERGNATLGQEEAHGGVHAVEALPDPAPDSIVLRRRGAHQRHLRVVDVEKPSLELLRHGVARAEIDHVERADRAEIRHAGADHRAHAVLGRRQHAAQ